MRGFFHLYDAHYKISGPFGQAEITEYNDELTGFTENLVPLFKPGIVIYGGNAYYIMNECRKRGYTVERTNP